MAFMSLDASVVNTRVLGSSMIRECTDSLEERTARVCTRSEGLIESEKPPLPPDIGVNAVMVSKRWEKYTHRLARVQPFCCELNWVALSTDRRDCRATRRHGVGPPDLGACRPGQRR